MSRRALRPAAKEVWPAKLGMASLALSGSIAFALLAVSGGRNEYPLIATLMAWMFAALCLLVALGAAIRTSVEVDDDRNCSVAKTLLGLPFSKTRFQSGEVIRIELDRQMSVRSAGGGGGDGLLTKETPRYRIDAVYGNGKFLVMASSSFLYPQAERLAAALGCPLEKTGVW